MNNTNINNLKMASIQKEIEYWIRILIHETKENWSISTESNMYTLYWMDDVINVGITDKECLQSIKTLLNYNRKKKIYKIKQS